MNILDAQEHYPIYEVAAKSAGISYLDVTTGRDKDDYPCVTLNSGSNATKQQEEMLHKFYRFLWISVLSGKIDPAGDNREYILRMAELRMQRALRQQGEDVKNAHLYAETEARSWLKARIENFHLNKPDVIRLYKNNEPHEIHDEYFNPVVEADAPEATTPEPEERKFSLIKWIAPDVDFTCLIDALLRRKYIEASDLSEALRIAAPYFDGINNRTKTLIQGKNNRLKKNKFDVIPENKSKKKKLTAY